MKMVLKSLTFALASMACASVAIAESDPWLGITINGLPVPSRGYHYLLGDPMVHEWEYGVSRYVGGEDVFEMNNRIVLGTSASSRSAHFVREFIIDVDEHTPNSKRPIDELDITITTGFSNSSIDTVIIKGGYFGEKFGMHRQDSNVTQRVDVKITGGTFLCTYDPFHVGYWDSGKYYEGEFLDKWQCNWVAQDDYGKERYEKRATSTLAITGGSFAFDPSTVHMTEPVRDQMGKLIWEDYYDPERPSYHFRAKTRQVPVIASGYSVRFDESTGLWTVKSDVAWAEEDRKNEPKSDPPELYGEPDDDEFLGDMTYNGWVRGADGAIAGTLVIKAAKPAKPAKGGQSKLTITYTPFGGKKQSVKLDPAAMPVAGGNPTVDIPGIGAVKFGGTSLAGAGLQVGADLAKSKDKAAKAAANARLAKMNGTWTFALGTDAGYATFSLSVKKGKGKLTGTLPDGTKVAVSQQGVLGDKALAIPFAYAKKGACGFVFWIADGGTTVEVSDIAPLKLANGAVLAATLVEPSQAHKLAEGPHAFQTPYFVQSFAVAGKKWDVAKHVKKPTAENPDLNPYSVSLKFTEKTGAVKGSFSVPGPTGKAVKYTVNGVVVDGKFYGAATVKGGAPVACAAE